MYHYLFWFFFIYHEVQTKCLKWNFGMWEQYVHIFDLISTHFILSNNNMFKNEKDDKLALFITDVFFYKHLLQVLYLLVDWILNSTSVTKKDYYVNLIFKYLWPCKHNEKKISGDTSNHWSLNRKFQATCVIVCHYIKSNIKRSRLNVLIF